ncbi:MAG: [protein-PII] uridylyltransferase, partial [Verrucomicrobiae bacterium]|nr:[protein-PII] uridylyltransferase [Verrucomicrobiae bacterium]
LNPCSDLDIMFLHDGDDISDERPPWFIKPVSEGLLFDIGLKIGHSTRTVAECVSLANEDMKTKTSLIEARFICGDKQLFETFQQTILHECVERHEAEYIAARLRDQAERHSRFGNTVCLQEPNVKNGCGGLRDYHNLLWMAFFKYRSRSLDELQKLSLITESEKERLNEAYDFLLRVRNEMHYHVGRAADQLIKSIQPVVARNLGYTDRSLSRRIEKFMRDYYSRARTIYLLTSTLAERLALLPDRKTPPVRGAAGFAGGREGDRLCEGLRSVGGQIIAESDRVFLENPVMLMRVFLYAQQKGLTLHPELAQLIRQNVRLIDRRFRSDRHVHQTFIEILNQRGNVARVLRMMHETGVLGAYLPAFGRLTCHVQHEFFHRYTADEHSLVCIDKLDGIVGSGRKDMSIYSEILQKEIERPFILYLALLLHDAGKAAQKQDHAYHSSRIALSVARRLGLDQSATDMLVRLIRLHLTMVHISQRRDLDDPGQIQRFAAQVENVETLNLLTLLTLADSLGTSDELWNGFKNSLLLTLYHRTRALLAKPDQLLPVTDQSRARLMSTVGAMLPSWIGQDEVDAHFTLMPQRYFVVSAPEEIVEDIELVHRFLCRQLAEDEDPLAPVVSWRDEPDRGFSLVRVVTWDRPGLFNKFTGALTAAGLNILSAEIFTRGDDIVLDAFYVIDAVTGGLADTHARAEFEETLCAALSGKVDLAGCIRQRMARWRAHRPTERDRIPTVIRFDNTTSDSMTVLDIEAEDRVGLLHAISLALSELGIGISLAKICTEKGAAFDTFYVEEQGGGKILDPKRQELIRARLSAAISRLDEE